MDSPITPSNLLADVQKLPLELRLVTPEVTAGLLGTTFWRSTPETGGDEIEKSNEKRAHGRSDRNPANDCNICVFRSDGVFGRQRIFREGLLWFDDAQPPNLTKVPLVERGHLAPALQSRRPDNQVIETNHFSGGLQFGPDSSMFVRSLLGVGNDR